ncbi:MAG: phosphoribosylglycinamide formyltransferase [Pseudomonadota bacterium]|nr:phosphoribosylglycinamide formyltransferase [Pseudomonadota bacterium]
MARLNVAVLISGRGSNLQALIDGCAVADFPAQIGLVISNVAGAAGLDRAQEAGIATDVIDHRDYADREGFEAALDRALTAAGIELICLAGFMRLLTPGFVDRWKDRLINIHPSLLPAYKGLDTHARVLADGVRFTGCTVHFVRVKMDHGPIIIQAAVPVHRDDDEDTLAARVLAAEHLCYPRALRLIAEGKLEITDEIVTITGIDSPDTVLINPKIDC